MQLECAAPQGFELPFSCRNHQFGVVQSADVMSGTHASTELVGPPSAILIPKVRMQKLNANLQPSEAKGCKPTESAQKSSSVTLSEAPVAETEEVP